MLSQIIIVLNGCVIFQQRDQPWFTKSLPHCLIRTFFFYFFFLQLTDNVARKLLMTLVFLPLIFDRFLTVFSSILEYPRPSPATLKLYNFQFARNDGHDEMNNYKSNRCIAAHWLHNCVMLGTGPTSVTACLYILRLVLATSQAKWQKAQVPELDWIQILTRLFPVRPRGPYLTSLCLYFLIYKVEMVTFSAWGRRGHQGREQITAGVSRAPTRCQVLCQRLCGNDLVCSLPQHRG